MAASVVATLHGMLGEKPDFDVPASDAELRDVRRAIDAVRPYWKHAL